MKRKLYLFALLSCLLSFNQLNAQEHKTVSSQRMLPYWQDVSVVQVNKEYPRTQFMTYDNKAEALQNRFEESQYHLSLNGRWKFFFVDGYKQLPGNITDSTVSLTGWKEINVPGNW